MEDLYSILGVGRDADGASIKKAYRRLATKYHPDKTGGDKKAEASLKKVNHAYSILGDPDKRSQYDQMGETGFSDAFSNFNGGAFRGGSADLRDIFDGFEEIFGQTASSSRGGADVVQQVSISFEEAYKGTTKTLKVRLKSACSGCKGTGAKNGTEFETCKSCQGSGMLRIQRGFFSAHQTCPSCRGRGNRIKKACDKCNGKAWVSELKEIRVDIPAGIGDGDRIRVRGQGEFGAGGSGDLYVLVRVAKHPIFRFEGTSLVCELPIGMVDATLGCQVILPLPDGKISVKVPPGTQTGEVLRLRGKGVPDPRGGARGHLLCQVIVETPINLNAEQKELFDKLKTSLAKNVKKHSPSHQGWTEKIKNLFH